MSKCNEDPKGDMIPFIPEGYETLDYHNYDFNRCLTRQDRLGPFDEEDVVAAILSARGAVGIAAGYLGRSRSALMRWLKANSRILAIVEDYKATQLDAVEVNTMDSAIYKDDGADRRFLLQTIGKERGFSSRQEMTGKDGAPLALADLSQMSNGQLRKLKDLADEAKKGAPDAADAEDERPREDGGK